jgi:hypothetical protein
MAKTTTKPFAGIMCLQPATSIEAAASAYADANFVLPVEDRSWCLLILGQAIVAWGTADNAIQRNPTGADRLWIMQLGDDALLAFYATLLQSIADYHPPPFDLNDYLAAAYPASIPMRGMEVPPSTSPWDR